MLNTKFEAYKIHREIKRSGNLYTVKRKEKNEFGEPTGEILEIGEFCGLYHELYHKQNGSISITTGETTQTRTKKTPAILCLYEDINYQEIKVGDFIEFNGNLFLITAMVNVQNWNIISDISLEVVDYGEFES